MLFAALFGKGLLTMLAPDPGYEAWTASEGLDGETDFHIADSPFLYTNGWDFVGVRYYWAGKKFDMTFNFPELCRANICQME